MVLLMQARQGSSEIVVMVIQYLEQKRKDSSVKIDMQIFFEAVKMTKGWDRAATEKLIQRGRFLFKLTCIDRRRCVHCPAQPTSDLQARRSQGDKWKRMPHAVGFGQVYLAFSARRYFDTRSKQSRQ